MTGTIHTPQDLELAVIEGAVQRLRPKLMTVAAVLASLVPILWESGVGSDVMKPIATPIVGGMITSTIHVLILVPVFFVMMKERSLRRGSLRTKSQELAYENATDEAEISPLGCTILYSSLLIHLTVRLDSSLRAMDAGIAKGWQAHFPI